MEVPMKPEIGIFGGSGFYSLMDDMEKVKIETPYGSPSAKVALGKIGGRNVAFLPRHGKSHEFPPHKVPFLANVYAMKSLGVTRLISPCAAGSLQTNVKPGDFVILDQFVDRTGRPSTYYHGPTATHVSLAEPYCPELRQVAKKVSKKLGIPAHPEGTVVVIQGPRFSTKAESRWFNKQGWEVINMTQYPEVALAREQEMCFLGLALITDYDAGLEGSDIEPVDADEVLKIFEENIDKVKALLNALIPRIPAKRSCSCGQALKTARL